MNRYRKSYTVKVGTVMLSTLLLLGSCSEDAIIDDNGGKLGAASDNICFGISDNDGWPETRSAHTTADEVVTENFVLRSADNADTLCVQTTVCDFGPLPFGNNAPTSRAALVSEANMHGSFGVTACLTKDNSYLFFNEENRKPDNYNPSAIWSYVSGNIYYWPGEAHPLKFYAYSPYGCEGLTPPAQPDKGNAAPSFSYTVPVDAANQTDLLAYATEEMSGVTNSSVPLSFQHICTAVQFVVGKEMQPGTIKNIRLKGVKNNGTYSFETGWNLDGTTTDFVHNMNKDVSVSTPDDTEKENITDDADCFIMLPQTLPDGASVEIVFHDNTTGTDRTLTASIVGQEWPQGKRVKYNISISPDYILDISDIPETQDAHYVICKASIKAEKIPAGKQWTLKAVASDGADVTMLPQLDEYQRNGFWTDRVLFQANGSTDFVDQGSARGTSTLTGTGTSDVYLFLPENVGEKERTITLVLTLDGDNVSSVEKEFKQLNPDGDYGWEQIENDPLATWGFLWNRKITYKKENVFLNLFIYGPMVENLVNEYNASDYAIVTNTSIFQKTTIDIDYAKLNNLSKLNLSTEQGAQNTKDLYSFSGSATTGNLEQAIKNLSRWGSSGVFNEINPSGENNMESAALGYILKKNKYNLARIEKIDGDDVVISESPVIRTDDIVWYLPAKDQFSNGPTTLPLEGEYWSSTPEGSENAYTNKGSVGRMQKRKIRACRYTPE